MKHNIKELDVDFIGEQNRPMSKEEQIEISVFIQKQKNERKNKNNSIIRKKEKLFA